MSGFRTPEQQYGEVAQPDRLTRMRQRAIQALDSLNIAYAKDTVPFDKEAKAKLAIAPEKLPAFLEHFRTSAKDFEYSYDQVVTQILEIVTDFTALLILSGEAKKIPLKVRMMRNLPQGNEFVEILAKVCAWEKGIDRSQARTAVFLLLTKEMLRPVDERLDPSSEAELNALCDDLTEFTQKDVTLLRQFLLPDADALDAAFIAFTLGHLRMKRLSFLSTLAEKFSYEAGQFDPKTGQVETAMAEEKKPTVMRLKAAVFGALIGTALYFPAGEGLTQSALFQAAAMLSTLGAGFDLQSIAIQHFFGEFVEAHETAHQLSSSVSDETGADGEQRKRVKLGFFHS